MKIVNMEVILQNKALRKGEKMTKEEFLKKLSDCVVDMEEDSVVDVAKEYIQAGHDPLDGMLNGLVDGMKRASQLFDEEEYYIPELLVCSDAMNNGIEEFKKTSAGIE